MFVRFKRVKLSTKSGLPAEYSLHAVLVENHRDHNGKPRQQIISYLGSIRERNIYSQVHRSEFLQTIQRKLRELSLTPRDLSRIQLNLINNITHKFHITRA
jgi:hypothetical protein